MTADSLIDYEALAQEAMRNVVRSVLVETAAKGLPGDHHFYISFDTLAPGVILSKRLREKYAEEMTIVLQHRFWDLIIDDERFEVKLTFDGIPERLVVPFKSIRVFFDPSVRYGLQFESINGATDLSGQGDIDDIDTAFDDPFAARGPGRSTPATVPLIKDRPGRSETSPTPLRTSTASSSNDHDGGSESGDAELDATGTDEADADNASAEIVSLDAFRKK